MENRELTDAMQKRRNTFVTEIADAILPEDTPLEERVKMWWKLGYIGDD